MELSVAIRISLRVMLLLQPAGCGGTLYMLCLACGLTGKLRRVISYFVIRILILSGFATILEYYYGDTLAYHLITMILMIILNLFSLWVDWRNFAGSLLKVFVVQLVVDSLSAGLINGSAVIVNLLTHRTDPMSINGQTMLLPYDILIPVIYFAMLMIVTRILRPAFDWCRGWDVRHRRIAWFAAWAFWLMIIVVSTESFEDTYYWATALSSVVLIWAICALFWMFRQRLHTEHSFYESERRIITYDLIHMQEQLQQIEESIRTSHRQLDRLRTYGVQRDDSGLREYLEKMRTTSEGIFKHYTPYKTINAVLTYEEMMCRQMGIWADFAVRQLTLAEGAQEAEETLAKMLLLILDTAILQTQEGRSRTKRIALHEEKKTLHLQILSMKGQILISANWPGKMRKQTQKHLEREIRQSNGTVEYRSGREDSALEVMVEHG